MQASEFIALLQSLVEKHGDLTLVTEHNEEISFVEFNDEDGDPVFVVG